MPDKLTRKDRFKNLDKWGRNLETVESLNEFVILYKKEINNKINSLVKGKSGRLRLKEELDIIV